MSSKPIVVKLNLDKTGFSQGIVSAQRQMGQLQAATQQMGHGTVSSMQAASAAIRVFEGGMTGNIRAAERFIGTIPGVGKALQAAFPLVGAIALGGVFAKVGMELATFIEATNKVPKAIEQAFQAMHTSAAITNDDLQISTDKLRNQLAVLEHKPVNMAALALHETWLEADQLARTLEETDKSMASLMKENKISLMGALLTGKTGTAYVSGGLQSYHDQEADLSYQHAQAVKSGNTGLAASTLKQLNDKIESEHEYTQREIAGFRSGQALGDPTANIKLLEGDDQSISDTQEATKNTKANKDAQLALDTETKKQEAARKAAAANKAAQEAIIAGWRTSLGEVQPYFTQILLQEAQFWNQRAEFSKRGSISYIAASNETNKVMARMHGEDLRMQAEFAKTSAISPDSMDLSRGDNGEMATGGRDAVDYLKNLNAGITASRASSSAYQESALEMEVMTGRMSELDGAQVRATMHTQEFTEAQNALQDALAAANQLPDSLSKQATIAGLNNQGAQMNAQRELQVAQDHQNISGQQVGPAMTKAVNDMVNGWTNASQQIVGLFQNSVNTFNGTLVNVLTSRNREHSIHRQFEAAGHSIFTDATSRGIQGAEGMLGKALGFGSLKKADGSAGNPFHVIMDGAAGGASGIAGAASKIASGGGGFLGSIGKWIQPFFQGGFADGGDFMANHPMMVGERGPELLYPRMSGAVVPNHKLGGNTIHVDARGSTDPAATEAAVHRAMGQYLPMAVAGSVAAVQDRSKRLPLSHR